MDILYVSDDEVHQAMAADLGLACGATIHAIGPADEPPDSRRFSGVLYDLDSVPHRRRAGYLARILSPGRARPTAVHGYQVTDEQAAMLRLRGISVGERLRLGLLQALCGAARRDLIAVPPDDALADETWIALDA
jgi:hypothetical protein